ncbi:MAG: T9SS type A sorting domain-containing protein [Flavobacteriales bacterium]|nr:T9SS type A sorting domain-containing protein [Flavobacteriales bacterium]
MTTAVLLSAISASTQCPTAPITFSTQAQINAFPTNYPACTVIPDGVDVKIMGNDINDLSPFAQVTEMLGVLEIRDCPLLISLNGLNNLTSLGNDTLDGFILRDLPTLNSMTALGNLTSLTGEFTIRTCGTITDLNGLNALDSAHGSVIIRDNASLQNFNGLNGLQFIGETLEIVGNPQLNDISALSNVTTIVGGPEGGVFIENNTTLTNLNGLGNNSTTIGGNLDLLLNGNLSLCSVPSICNYLANPPVGAIITINSNTTGCNTEPEILSGCTAVGTDELISTSQTINLYPNPFTDQFAINSSSPLSKVEIYDQIGRIIKTIEHPDNKPFDFSDASHGFYIVKITDISNKKHLIKVSKQ